MTDLDSDTQDRRTYIKVHDGLPDHPKVAGLSDGAFRLLVSAWCYCGRNLTDGMVPAAVMRRYGPPKAVRELVEAGLVYDHGPGGGYECHDYLSHQRSAEQVKARSKVNRENGRLGGAARAKRLASKSPSKSASESPSETQAEDRETEDRGLLRSPAEETETPPSRKPTRAKREGEWMSQVVEARRSAGAGDLRSWSSTACANAVQRAAEEHEVTPDVAWQALIELAGEADTQHPGRLTHQLQRVLEQATRTSKPGLRLVEPSAPPLLDPCGQCGPNRRVEGPNGEDMGACTNCHPSSLVLISGRGKPFWTTKWDQWKYA